MIHEAHSASRLPLAQPEVTAQAKGQCRYRVVGRRRNGAGPFGEVREWPLL